MNSTLNSNYMMQAKGIVEKILELGGLDAKVVVKNDNLLEASGKDSAIIIGRGGSTLFAIDTLLNNILNKDRENRVKIIFDVEGYRQRHTNMQAPDRRTPYIERGNSINQTTLDNTTRNPYNRNPYNSYNYAKKTPYSYNNNSSSKPYSNPYLKNNRNRPFNQANNRYKPYNTSTQRQNSNEKANY